MKAEQTIEQDTELLPTGLGDAVSARPDRSVAEIVEEDVWRRDNPEMVCPPQAATLVYQNNYGQAVIRQERTWNEEEDTYVIISKHYLQDVIDRLQRILSSDE
jgi:hypothetical protein